jgi:hypothetical protein
MSTDVHDVHLCVAFVEDRTVHGVRSPRDRTDEPHPRVATVDHRIGRARSAANDTSSDRLT